MSTLEEQQMMARISQLAGQINRHKNQQQAGASHTNMDSPYSRNTPRSQWAPPTRGAHRGRGYHRGGKAPTIHRNKTLILNGATPTSDRTKTTLEESSTAAPSAWVTKTDRHLQLINPAIYEKQSQERAKAMEETRKLKLKQRDEKERRKLSKHMQRMTGYTGSNPTMKTQGIPSYEITVQGIRFRVMKNGSKLMKVPGDENAAKMTPKTATIGGVRFYRSKNGNLYRSGIVQAQRYDLKPQRTINLRKNGGTNMCGFRRSGVVKKIDEPCRKFANTGICPKGPQCRYMHDPNKVAVCKEFLMNGSCEAGDSCDLSHDLTAERTPVCLHFTKGNCSNANCRYIHVRVSPSAPVCHAFGIYGYCEKGATCADRHVHECPDFSNTGVCNTKGCKLPHRLKASVIRKNAAKADADEGSSDLSSDDEGDEIDSDDVDSDAIEEEFFGEGEKDEDIPMQQDFVQF